MSFTVFWTELSTNFKMLTKFHTFVCFPGLEIGQNNFSTYFRLLNTDWTLYLMSTTKPFLKSDSLVCVHRTERGTREIVCNNQNNAGSRLLTFHASLRKLSCRLCISISTKKFDLRITILNKFPSIHCVDVKFNYMYMYV